MTEGPEAGSRSGRRTNGSGSGRPKNIVRYGSGSATLVKLIYTNYFRFWTSRKSSRRSETTPNCCSRPERGRLSWRTSSGRPRPSCRGRRCQRQPTRTPTRRVSRPNRWPFYSFLLLYVCPVCHTKVFLPVLFVIQKIINYPLFQTCYK